MYTEENAHLDRMKTMSNNITVKLNDEERRSIEGNIKWLFYGCLVNSENYSPKVPRTARCTISRGRRQ